MEENEVRLRERVTALENGLRGVCARVDRIDSIVMSINEVVIELKQMRTDMNRIDRKVTEIEEKPAKRWESVVAALIGAVAGGIGTAFISLILGG